MEKLVKSMEQMQLSKDLMPVTARRQEFLDVFDKHSVVVLTSDTGPGKTTPADLAYFQESRMAKKTNGESRQPFIYDSFEKARQA
ncbi:hypothetical protein F4803DRAFT_546156 [Xylaria telfairii]|nr:hypothetical protein F4803DRAFT_546156 [Xylaria telfairii]